MLSHQYNNRHVLGKKAVYYLFSFAKCNILTRQDDFNVLLTTKVLSVLHGICQFLLVCIMLT